MQSQPAELERLEVTGLGTQAPVQGVQRPWVLLRAGGQYSSLSASCSESRSHVTQFLSYRPAPSWEVGALCNSHLFLDGVDPAGAMWYRPGGHQWLSVLGGY